MSDFKVNDQHKVAVDHNYFWQPMETCPHSVKVQLLGKGGVAVYGVYNGREDFWQAWAPLPKRPLNMKD